MGMSAVNTLDSSSSEMPNSFPGTTPPGHREQEAVPQAPAFPATTLPKLISPPGSPLRLLLAVGAMLSQREGVRESVLALSPEVIPQSQPGACGKGQLAKQVGE